MVELSGSVVMGLIHVAVTYTSDIAPALRKEFLDIQATLECRFTLKRVFDMIRTYSHLYDLSEQVKIT